MHLCCTREKDARRESVRVALLGGGGRAKVTVGRHDDNGVWRRASKREGGGLNRKCRCAVAMVTKGPGGRSAEREISGAFWL